MSDREGREEDAAWERWRGVDKLRCPDCGLSGGYHDEECSRYEPDEDEEVADDD